MSIGVYGGSGWCFCYHIVSVYCAMVMFSVYSINITFLCGEMLQSVLF